MSVPAALKVQIFADVAELSVARALARAPHIRGFTTNPTLMHQAGVRDYRRFARELLAEVTDRPVCFEVTADELEDMERQALGMADWAQNVFVKVPVMNTRRESTAPLVQRLARRGVRLNVTAVLTLAQVRTLAAYLEPDTPSFVSIFAGRIADTGIDPQPVLAHAASLLEHLPGARLVWASARELLNVFQAEAVGCPVITLPASLLAKLPLIGRDLTEYSLETVRMFYEDARAAGLQP